jgi:glycosyltransferase involved in cell wall biosynthesis
MPPEKIKVALIENFGLDFLNFRVPLVRFLEESGYDVYAIIPDDEYCSLVEKSGIKVIRYSMAKNTMNLFSYLKCILYFCRLARKYKFQLAHSFRLQPNVITNLSFGFYRSTSIINHITGLGHAFTANTFRSNIYKILILGIYQFVLLFSKKIVVQNNVDFNILSRLSAISNKLVIIKGSGIDHKKFSRSSADLSDVSDLREKLKLRPNDLVITFTGRLLIDKGLHEFLALAERMSDPRSQLKFVVAGWFDVQNPSCIPEKYLNHSIVNGYIMYTGQIHNVCELLYLTDIFILPTYREGFPRSVLEAMSMEIPVITTDVPGSTDAVSDGYNGLIVKPRSVDDLESALKRLLGNELLRIEMGRNGRALIEEKFNSGIIFNEILKVYTESME